MNTVSLCEFEPGQIIEEFEGYAYTVEMDSHVIKFVVCKIMGSTDDGEGRCYHDKHCNFVFRFVDAEPFLHGYIKWDGCSNWDWHDRDCMQHFCGREDAVSIGALMNHLYDIAAQRLPTFLD